MDSCESELLPPTRSGPMGSVARRTGASSGKAAAQGLPAARSSRGTRPVRNGTVSPAGPLYLADREQLLTSRFARISEGGTRLHGSCLRRERRDLGHLAPESKLQNRPARREGRGDSCMGTLRWAGDKRAPGQLTGKLRSGVSRGHCHPRDRGDQAEGTQLLSGRP